MNKPTTENQLIHNDTDDHSANNGDTPMSLVDHLVELRSRLLVTLSSIGFIFVSLVYFSNDIYSLASQPIRDALPEGSSMIATEITSTFFAPFKLTLFVAFVLAAPIILHQIWKFIAPGLYQHEKKIAIPLLVSSVLLFYLGIIFAYIVIFPIVMGFFTHIGPVDVEIAPDINNYLSIALKLFFAFGFAFEIPIATLLLIWSGSISAENLGNKRGYVIVGCFVVGMLLTPPDIISQTLLAIPMWLLFEGGILLAKILPINPTNTNEAD